MRLHPDRANLPLDVVFHLTDVDFVPVDRFTLMFPLFKDLLRARPVSGEYEHLDHSWSLCTKASSDSSGHRCFNPFVLKRLSQVITGENDWIKLHFQTDGQEGLLRQVLAWGSCARVVDSAVFNVVTAGVGLGDLAILALPVRRRVRQPPRSLELGELLRGLHVAPAKVSLDGHPAGAPSCPPKPSSSDVEPRA